MTKLLCHNYGKLELPGAFSYLVFPLIGSFFVFVTPFPLTDSCSHGVNERTEVETHVGLCQSQHNKDETVVEQIG